MAPSKTLTSRAIKQQRKGAKDRRRSTDGAKDHSRSTAHHTGAPRQSTDHCEAGRSRTEHHGAIVYLIIHSLFQNCL